MYLFADYLKHRQRFACVGMCVCVCSVWFVCGVCVCGVCVCVVWCMCVVWCVCVLCGVWCVCCVVCGVWCVCVFVCFKRLRSNPMFGRCPFRISSDYRLLWQVFVVVDFSSFIGKCWDVISKISTKVSFQNLFDTYDNIPITTKNM